MEGSSTHLAYLEGGTYALSAGVVLTVANGNSIVANHFSNTGEAVLLTDGSSDNMLSGNEMDNSATSAVEVKNGSNDNVSDSNLVNGTGAIYMLARSGIDTQTVISGKQVDGTGGNYAPGAGVRTHCDRRRPKPRSAAVSSGPAAPTSYRYRQGHFRPGSASSPVYRSRRAARSPAPSR
jgi:parallel beta-helix repeat protein